MWNLISASKVTQDRIRRKNYEKHRSNVNSMKPIMHIKEPEQPDFVYLKPKLEMARRDKLIEIDKQNQILLNKMQIIKATKYMQNKLRPEAQHLKTLNQHIVSQHLQEIYNENKRFCQKLLKVESHYPTFQAIDKAEKLQRVKLNISQNARRVMSARSLQRPQSSTTRSSRFYRSRVNKYDQEGNSSQEKINILYKMSSQANMRPESAPASKRTGPRPYSSERPQFNPKTLEAQQQRQNIGHEIKPQYTQ